MAWIRTVPDSEAEGLLKTLYTAIRRRAGRIFNVTRLMSLNPRAMQANMRYYEEVMFGESPLDRAQREMLAVVVSAANGCVY